jgi:lysophospholipase L1-like esterase
MLTHSFAAAALVCGLLCTGIFAQQTIRITCVGNSITQGGYPEVLGEMLGAGYEVTNCGRHSKAVARNCEEPYSESEVFLEVFSSAPDHITIMLGTNDTRPPMWPCREQFLDDLLWLIDRFASIPTDPRIWLCLPPPATDDNKFDIYGSRIVDAIIPDIETAAQLRGLSIIDVHTPFVDKDRAIYFKDGVHPNETGKQAIAGILYDALSTATSVRAGFRPLSMRPGSTRPPRIRLDLPTVTVSGPARHTGPIDCRGRKRPRASH